MPQSISKLVRKLCADRLKSSAGLNAQISTLFGGSGLADKPLIDWNPEARQFFQANLTFEDVVDSDNPATPCVFLYCLRTENQNRVKFKTFAGDVEVRIDVEIEIPETVGPEALEDYADLIEESLIRCFNSQWDEVSGILKVTYNGNVRTERSAATSDESAGWRQTISANLIFGVTL